MPRMESERRSEGCRIITREQREAVQLPVEQD